MGSRRPAQECKEALDATLKYKMCITNALKCKQLASKSESCLKSEKMFADRAASAKGLDDHSK